MTNTTIDPRYIAEARELLAAECDKSRIKRVRQSTPAWADMAAIRDFYLACPAGHHVDHVIPINGAVVCGLHVVDNLQYLPASENIKKRNYFNWEDQK